MGAMGAMGEPGADAMLAVVPDGGLSGDGSAQAPLAIQFGGSGSAPLAAHADHDHAGAYLPRGASVACPAGQVVRGLDPATGNVNCATDETAAADPFVARTDTPNVFTGLQTVQAAPGQTGNLQQWRNGSGATVASVSATGGFVGSGAGLVSLNPANLTAGTANIDISGNAATVTNGVVITASYANPPWISALAASKLTGTLAPGQLSGAYPGITSVGTLNSVTSSGNIGFAPARTRTLSIPSVEWRSVNSAAVVTGDRVDVTGPSVLYVPLHLPEGVTVSDITCALRDDSTSHGMRVHMIYTNIIGGHGNAGGPSTTQAEAPGRVGRSGPSFFPFTVDNDTYAYHLQWTPDTGCGSACAVGNCFLTYTQSSL